MRLPAFEHKRARIEIVPMIDTIFFLLVFFMLSSLALTKMNGLPVNLPAASTSPKQGPVDLTVTVDRDQHIFVNKTPVTIEGLADELRTRAAGADLTDVPIVINADKIVPHGLVVQCIDEARSVGITHFSIATEADAGK